MNRQLHFWLLILGSVAVSAGPAWLLARYLHNSPVLSWGGLLLAVICILFARSYVRRFPPEQSGTFPVGRRFMLLQKWAVIAGFVMVPASVLWVVFGFTYVPNTEVGAILLFGPFFVLLLGGAGLILFAVIGWIWSRSG